jgi:predicted RNase H-like HicB family nuclease
MQAYPAILYAKDGSFVVSVPDLPGCKASGKTMQDAVRNAFAAVARNLEMYSEKNAEIPQPRSLENAIREFYPNVVAHLLIPVEFVGRVVRLNISMDESIVSLADRRSTQLGMTRSGYIAHLIRTESAGKKVGAPSAKAARRKRS